jgi:hypothetical protein
MFTATNFHRMTIERRSVLSTDAQFEIRKQIVQNAGKLADSELHEMEMMFSNLL